VKAQSEVVFDEERNAHMSCQHGSNEIDIFGLPEDEEYVDEIHTGDEPLRGQDSQPTQIGKRFKSHMHEAPDEEVENNAHSRRLHREDHTAQSSAADAENIAHSRRLRREDQTAQRSAADAEIIAHSRRLRREDQTARRSAAAIKRSSQVPPASPARAPPIGSRVTRSQGKASLDALTACAATGDPFSYAEAMESPQRDHWKRAMEQESSSIMLNNTFSALTSREARQLQVKPTGSKWGYKTKHNPDGSTRYKARLVIKGYEQTDFGETYAPVGKLTTFRYLISLIGTYWWNMDYLDVVTAFLNPAIDDDDIYMTLPEGWPVGFNAPKIIVRLRKALYGLKQAPRLWHDDINAFLLSLWFTKSSADPNLYLPSDGILILLYVDDISMLYPEAATKAAIEVKAKLSEKYKITNLGPARQFLGIEIHRDGTGVSLGQKGYITTILRRFGMEHTHGVSTPMDPNVKLDLAEDRGEKELKEITDYQAVVGSLMYAALATRPDISYAVAALFRYNSRPFTSHMTTAKRVLQYLKYTADFRLHFNGNGTGNGIGNGIGIDIGNSLSGYLDSDWGKESADRKFQGGHVFVAGNGGAVSWQSRQQSLIAMSTLDAEFIACSEASREAKWLLQLQKDIHSSQRDSPLLPINCDNQGALTLITTGIIKARTKHIDVCYHNSRDLHKRRIVNYSYIHMDENVADLLTKAFTKDKHTKFTKAMGLW